MAFAGLSKESSCKNKKKMSSDCSQLMTYVYILQVNISRDEYDRQRQQMLFDDDDIALAQVEEYHQFSVIPTDDNELERRETVILNHGKFEFSHLNVIFFFCTVCLFIVFS